ncbi:Nucleoside triphosphate pyrophosphohydrolase MazG [hydrothermal vent metagenome]|uniref:Nucleoside triphosphate pyrophosphohydrolase MazG n=1 Tax=hydrothermal vent metagenome TaxID=652676 RepID=A0A3B1A9U5_9ZZZZ
MKKLLDIMSRLRDPKTGCPWDLKQTYQSIVPHTLEEAYEVAEVIEQHRLDDLPDELGDLLFQIVFYSQLAKEQNKFEFDDVVEAICTKLIRRHPHVFNREGDAVSSYDLLNPNAIKQQNLAWDKLKSEERNNSNNKNSSVLDNINSVLPSLSVAQKIQRRVSNEGFDWPDISGALEKCHEEINEVEHEITLVSAGQENHIEEELGDLLFACVNVARHSGVDSEAALRKANAKFESRFRQVEQLLLPSGGLQKASLSEMDAAWNTVKEKEHAGNKNKLSRS